MLMMALSAYRHIEMNLGKTRGSITDYQIVKKAMNEISNKIPVKVFNRARATEYCTKLKN